jgi:hypothetical protein
MGSDVPLNWQRQPYHIKPQILERYPLFDSYEGEGIPGLSYLQQRDHDEKQLSLPRKAYQVENDQQCDICKRLIAGNTGNLAIHRKNCTGVGEDDPEAYLPPSKRSHPCRLTGCDVICQIFEHGVDT